MKTSATNHGRVAAYSSEQLSPLQIHEENAHGSSRPASRQVFSVELKSNRETHSGLVIRSSSQRPRLALLTANLDRRYDTQGGEAELPMTPRLAAQFDGISKQRKGLSHSRTEIPTRASTRITNTCATIRGSNFHRPPRPSCKATSRM